MARRVDSAAQQRWRQRLQRFAQRGSLTVADFCRQEQVFVPSLYQWRKKLSRPASPRRAPASTASRPGFLPVRLVSSAPASRLPTAVEVHLPNGARIVLPADDPPLPTAAINFHPSQPFE